MGISLLTGSVVLGLAGAIATPVIGSGVGNQPAAVAPAQAGPAAQAAPVVVAPDAQVMFNDPTGGEGEQNRIADRIRRAIDETPEGGTIRMAAYSFDRPDIAEALRRACTQRAVSVQVVVNDNFTSPSTRRLQRLLGTGPEAGHDACGASTTPSFVRICHSSCRLGDRGNQHMKVYLFSETGGATDVVMMGSANLTDYAAGIHWNDLVTFTGSRQLFDDYSEVFAELAADRLVESPAVAVAHGDVATSVASGRPATPDEDEVAQRLAGVDCDAQPGTGVDGRTVVRVSMYGWRGARGLDLAQRMARLTRQGCRVEALVSAAGPDVVGTLMDAGVRVRSGSLDVDGDVTTGFEDSGWEHFIHEKWMSVDGTWGGEATRAVWTGSENWSDVSLLNDELVVMVPRDEVHDAYAAHFANIWKNHSKEIAPLGEAA